MGATARGVGEAHHPEAVGELEGAPQRLQLVIGEAKPPLEEVASHRCSERERGRTEARLVEHQLSGPVHDLRLLGPNGSGEAGDPGDVGPRLPSDLLHRRPCPQPVLELSGRQRASLACRRPVRTGLRAGSVADPAGAHPAGVAHELQQPVVERHHVRAGRGAFAVGQDQPVELGREADEVELLHTVPR